MSSTMPSQVLIEIVKATAERLRPLGFTRRGMALRIMGLDTCGILAFQRSGKNSQDRCLFTVNLGIVCGKLLERDETELSKAQIIDAHVRDRIGSLLPDHHDKWWEITPSTDAQALAQEVVDLIVNKAVPCIQRYLSTESVIALWESGQSPGLTARRRVELLAVLKTKR